ALLVTLSPCHLVTLSAAAGELYQDLRGESELRPGLKWMGGGGKYRSPAPEGLGGTVAAMRRDLNPIRGGGRFQLEGDFEVVGTYELLSADRPTKGYGVGVDLFIEVGPERRRLAKVARYNTVARGHVYLAQITDRDRPAATPAKRTATTETSG